MCFTPAASSASASSFGFEVGLVAGLKILEPKFPALGHAITVRKIGEFFGSIP